MSFIDNLKIENGISIVDLAEIEPLLGKEIEVLVNAYYDSGITGFETNGERFALQELKNDNYFVIIINSSLVGFPLGYKLIQLRFSYI